MLFKGFRLIDGTGKEPVENAYMLVEDDRILKIGEVDELKSTNGLVEVDLQGKTVMPGLINSHVHITMEPIGDPTSLMAKESQSKTALRGVANLRKHLLSGTTFLEM